jgi:hypothetical protein
MCVLQMVDNVTQSKSVLKRNVNVEVVFCMMAPLVQVRAFIQEYTHKTHHIASLPTSRQKVVFALHVPRFNKYGCNNLLRQAGKFSN